jgi:hypothetical protein
MPRVAVRPLRSSLCRFPHASPGSPSPAGKQETAPEDHPKPLTSLMKFGAGEGIRTLDPNLGKVVRRGCFAEYQRNISVSARDSPVRVLAEGAVFGTAGAEPKR